MLRPGTAAPVTGQFEAAAAGAARGTSRLYSLARALTFELEPEPHPTRRSDEAYAKYVESSSSAGVYLNLHKHEATREARNKKGVYLSSSCGGSQVRATARRGAVVWVA